MYLSRHHTASGARWALDHCFLKPEASLVGLMQVPAERLPDVLQGLVTSEPSPDEVLAPVEAGQEVWAAGVAYLSSRMAREAESQSSDVYQRVYHAERPRCFSSLPVDG